MRPPVDSFVRTLLQFLTFSLFCTASILATPADADAQTYSMETSAFADRSSPAPLSGATIVGDIHVFTTPTSGVDRVRFWLDQTTMSGTPFRTEDNAPFDFAGGNVSTATPYDSEDLTDGPHTITARIDLTSGAMVVIHSTFTVANLAQSLVFAPTSSGAALESGLSSTSVVNLATSDGSIVAPTLAESASWLSWSASGSATPLAITLTYDAQGLAAGTYSTTVSAQNAGYSTASLPVTLTVSSAPAAYGLYLSDSPDRSDPVPLAGQSVAGEIYVFTGPDSSTRKVRFWLDNPAMSGTPTRTENVGPFDFASGTSTIAYPYQTSALADGAHSITAAITPLSGADSIVHAEFTVANSAPGLFCSPASLTLAASSVGAESIGSVLLSATGSVANFSVAIPASATWLSANPASGQTPANIEFAAHPGGLLPGSYSAVATISAPGFAPTIVDVEFQVVDGSPILEFSTGGLFFTEASAGLSLPDQGAFVSASSGVADVTIAVPPDAGWCSVTPASGDSPLALTIGVDATGLGAGTHVTWITASAPGAISAQLEVSFAVGSPYHILYSSSPQRSNPQYLTGEATDGWIYVFTGPDDDDIDFVEYWVDDPSMAGIRYRLEVTAPYDLEAGLPGGSARPFQTENQADGAHIITAKLTFHDGNSVVVHAAFTILNHAPALSLSESTITLRPEAGGTESATIAVTATDGASTTFAVQSSLPSWLTIGTTDSTTPGEILVEADSAGLADDLYLATVEVTAPGFAPTTLLVRLTVGATGLEFFAGDGFPDTAVSIDGSDWQINGVVTYEGRYWTNPANGQSRRIEGLMMNARLVQGAYDDLDGNLHSSMLPWDPTANTEDYIENMAIWRAHGLLSFNLSMQGGANPAVASSSVDMNPYGADGRRCFDDWDAGLDTPHSQYLARIGSIIRAADDLGMVVELCAFYWGQDQRLDDNDAVIAALSGLIDWVLVNGWTNVIIEVANEASHQPSGVYAFDHTLLRTVGVVTLLELVQDSSSGSVGAHLPHGHLLTSVSGHGGFIPTTEWILTADYVNWHGNSQNATSTLSKLDTIDSLAAYQQNPKPIYTNEQDRDLSVIDPHLIHHASWGYHGREEYQRVFPTTNATRWTISKDPAWWNMLAEITGSNP